MLALEMAELHKSFGPRTVIEGVSLSLEEGGRACLIGPSGGGKSTLARLAAGLEKPDQGQVRLFGQDSSTLSTAQCASLRGMIFQGFHLFEHLSIVDQATLAPRLVQRLSPKEAKDRAVYWLERVGLKNHLHQKPSTLSGGQKQRAAIARALCMEPKLLILDEPTSALDVELVGEVQQVISDLSSEGRTLLLVTHDLQFARHVATTLAFVAEGKILEQGSPSQVLDSPSHPRTQAFLKAVNKEESHEF